MEETKKLLETLSQNEKNALFTEYFMMTVSKAMKCDEIADALEDKNCTIEQVRKILYGEEDD